MKERLVIKNFGPIKSVDLELGKMTILIGDNATGKSTIGKILAICRYFSYIVETSYELTYTDSFDNGLRYWGIFEYLKDDTSIIYECHDYHIEVNYAVKDWEYDTDYEGNVVGESYTTYAGAEVKFTFKSKEFEDLEKKLKDLQPWTKEEKNGNIFNVIPDWWNWQPNSNFFEIDVKKVMNNPFYFPSERGLQSIFSIGRSKSANDSLYEQLADLNSIATNFKTSTLIEPFNIYYQNSNGKGLIKSRNDESLHSLSNSASGYQTAIPIILTIKYYAEIERRYKRTYIIEEPETNLFPIRQKKLVEFIAESINKYDNQFLIPTHSPYILSVVNDLLMAFKKGQKYPNEVVELEFKKEIWLNPIHCFVYQIVDGNSKPLMNKELGLISENIIDDASDEINDNFNELLDIE